MAKLFPDGVDTVSASSALEAPTALRLAAELPSDWWVIHACHWTLPRGHKIGQGEVDFVVISPGGAIGLVEQKNGMVSVEGADYVKHYGLRRKSVSQQLGRSRHALMKKLADAQIQPRAVVSLLYVPDVEIVRVQGAGIDALAVIDAREAPKLAERLEMLLHCEPENLALVRALLNFFAGELDFRPSMHTLKAASTAAQVRLSGALRTVLEGFSMRPMRLCMEACAGAGKSEFIRLLAERSVASGRRTLALCYNRPLAALLREALPEQVEVDTWLGFRRRCAESLGLTLAFPEVADKAFWERLEREIENRLAAGSVSDDLRFDTILVDEAQDLDARAFACLQAYLAADGDFIWIGDPEQRLNESPPPSLDGFATFRLCENFRTPQALARELMDLAPVGTRFCNPLEGTGLRMVETTADGETLALAGEINRLRAGGHSLDDLIILELGGLPALDRFGLHIGDYSLRRFTGKYSADSEQILTNGDLDIETIWRFKGQQRAHVIVVGLGVEGLAKARTRRALYVALTRATVGASLLIVQGPPVAPV